MADQDTALYQLEVKLPSEDGQTITQVIKLKGLEQIIFKNRSEFPTTGDSEHIYFALDEDAIYLWRNGKYELFLNETIYDIATTSKYGRVRLSNGDVDTEPYQDGVAAGMNHSHSNYIPYGDWLMSTNPFCNKRLYINKIDNAFYAANKRWGVYGERINSKGIPYATLDGYDLADLFNGNYEGGLVVYAGESVRFYIDFDNKGNPKDLNDVQLAEKSGKYCYPGYPYGTILISSYHTYHPSNVTGVIESYWSGGEVEKPVMVDMYHAVPINKPAQRVDSLVNSGSYYTSKYTITITAPKDHYAMITEVEMFLDRPDPKRQPIISKYTPEKLYYDLTVPKVHGHLQDENYEHSSCTTENFATFESDGNLRERTIDEVVSDLNDKGLAHKNDLAAYKELKFHSRFEFPNVGVEGLLYIATNENKIYRWDKTDGVYHVVGSDYNDINLINCGGAN